MKNKEEIQKEIDKLEESLKPYEETIKTVDGMKKDIKKLKKQLNKIVFEEMSWEDQFLNVSANVHYNDVFKLKCSCPLFYDKFVDVANLNRYEIYDIYEQFREYLPWAFDEESVKEFKDSIKDSYFYDGEDIEEEYKLILEICKELLASKAKSFKCDW